MAEKESFKAVFLDRDGTICRDVNYCRRVEDFELLPGAAVAIGQLNRLGFMVIVITNQSGIARGYFDEAILDMIHRHMVEKLAEQDARIDAIYYCPHHPDDNCDCRKPEPGLFLMAAAGHKLTLSSSYMVGDAPRDIAAGKAAGCKSIWINAGNSEYTADTPPDYIARDLTEAVGWIIEESKSRST